MKKIKILLLLLILNIFIMSSVSADPTLIIEDYYFTPNVFMKGDSGLLTLKITNAETTNTFQQTTASGSTTTTRTYTVGAFINNIWIVYDSDSNGSKIKAVSNHEDVGSLAPGSSIYINFEMIAEKNITEGLYFPVVRIDIESFDDVQFPIPIKVSNEKVDVLLTDVPSRISKSGSTLITVTVVNNRKNPVDGVSITPQYADGVEFTPNSIYIGALETGESSDVSLSLKPSKIGFFNITFNINFKNGDNIHTQTCTFPLEIIDILDVGSVFTSIPRSIQKGSSSRITLEVYNAKTEEITGVIVTPISDAIVLPSQYFIGSMDPDDVFSASFDIFTENISYGNHTIEFEVSFKQGNEYYKTPTISMSYAVVEGQGSNFQLYDRTNGQSQGVPEMNIWGVCLPVIIAIALIISAIILYKIKKKRSK